MSREVELERPARVEQQRERVLHKPPPSNRSRRRRQGGSAGKGEAVRLSDLHVRGRQHNAALAPGTECELEYVTVKKKPGGGSGRCHPTEYVRFRKPIAASSVRMTRAKRRLSPNSECQGRSGPPKAKSSTQMLSRRVKGPLVSKVQPGLAQGSRTDSHTNKKSPAKTSRAHISFIVPKSQLTRRGRARDRRHATAITAHHDHHHLHSSSGRADGGVQVQGRVSSLYRPKTSLRLEGPCEYTTTSSDYFSTIDQSLVARAERYRLERQDVATATAGETAGTTVATAAAAAAAASGVSGAATVGAAAAASAGVTAAAGARHYPLTRPQTSLRTGGKTHYSTTTAEDFKVREQTEKVTRRLRPRKFDDPSYDSIHVDVESDVKKRRTEIESEVQVSPDGVQEEAERKAMEEAVHGGRFREDRGRETAQEVFHGHHFREKEVAPTGVRAQGEPYLETRHDHRAASTFDEGRDDFDVLHRYKAERSRLVDGSSTMENAEAFYHPEMSVPFYPKDNLAVSSGDMDLRTTSELDFCKKKMDRVRPVKPKSLAKLFGSNGSSSEGDPQATVSRRRKEQSVDRSSRLEQKDGVEELHAAGLSSTHEDSKMHLGANNVLIKRKSKGQRKAHFEDDSVKWEGAGSYSTTTRDSYKKPESTHARVALCRRPQSHDVFHRFTQTGDELRRIKGKKKDADEITMFGRKDSAELIAEIQGLLGASGTRRTEKKSVKQDASAHKKAGVESTSKRERAVQAVHEDARQGPRQGAHERARGHGKAKGAKKDGHQKSQIAEQEPTIVDEESAVVLKKRSAETSLEQRKSEMRVGEVSAGQQEYLESDATAKKFEAVHHRRAKTEDDIHRSEGVIVEGNEAQGYFDQGALGSEAQLLARHSAETPAASKLEASHVCPHVSSANRERLRFSTTTAESFKDVSEKIQPAKPFYPKPNLAPEGSMSFETVHHGEFTPKTVVEVPTPVRPVSTLKLSDDTSYVVRNEDKIGYSKTAPSVGGTRYSVRKPESTLVLGQDSVDYKTTSQLEYKAHESRELEDIYKKAVKVRRDRQRTYIRGQNAGAAVGGAQKQRLCTISGVEVTTTSREAFKPVTVERPQPYRPQSCLKVRSAEDSYAELSTTMRDTFRRVTPTARVKPIKREASLKKLGDDTDYTPRKTTTREAYGEVKMPQKPVPYRPTDNLKMTGGMTFSTTTQESYASRSSLQRNATEFAERAKPIKRDAVAKDIIFPVDSSGALLQGGTDYCSICKAEESAGVLRSLENTSSYARISKAPRERPRTNQKVGGGAFDHTTTSMAEYQDPRTQSWKQRSTATGRLVRTASAECPAAFLNTDRSEYVFKEVVGNHKFYLPAVQ
ncbi:hypothetical protein HPB50_018940 [Hyalomma asiaticum]|uniref:Uncharacterized protein n=1 Tax=Hyalomma asiaticum TaxID=266040 RepID=A0ACB7T053_HYAAI|nr:hypothetical protein HPB50_018940 [Hyalomma asiaticum]